MRRALMQLEYLDTYHGFATLENPMDSEMWLEALQFKYEKKGKPFTLQDWDSLLGHCMVGLISHSQEQLFRASQGTVLTRCFIGRDGCSSHVLR